MMQRGYTEIIYLLDCSGSMGALQEPAVAAFNDFVKSQKEVPGGALLTLIQFNDEHETTISPRRFGICIHGMQPITSHGEPPPCWTRLPALSRMWITG